MSVIEGMINVVRRTGHSSFYVEMGMGAMGKTAKQMHLQGELRVNGGGKASKDVPIDHPTEHSIPFAAFPVCPIAVIAAYSGSSQDDHNLVVNVVKDYLNKLARNSMAAPSEPSTIPAIIPIRESTAWIQEPASRYREGSESPPYDPHSQHDHRDDDYHE
ncbi:hypothetical protein HWV62_36127 [Athelia sp. TMB]|nr:hypothetical protein HWV62_993 [Athelia sp. TMB]KAF7980920.1 hypothetical protein HWV62_36127 [Athelia sp. TMB]